MNAVIAIDPGSSGAAVLRSDEPRVVGVSPYKGYSSHRIFYGPTSRFPVVIEKVWASPIMSQSNAFAFGANYGGWIAAAKITDRKVYAVTPQAWQKVVCPHITSTKDERKAELKAYAAQLFPDVKVTLTNADALLISEYALIQMRAGKPLGEEVV